MKANLHEQTVSQQQFALIVGISQGMVSRLVNDGTLARGGNLAQWVQAFVLRAESLASPDVEDAEHRRERTLLMRARRQVAGLDLRERRGELMRTDAHAARIVALAASLKQRLWSWVGALPGPLAGKEPSGVQRLLEAETRQFLTDLQEGFAASELRLLRWLLANAPGDCWQTETPTEREVLSLLLPAESDDAESVDA